MTIGLLCILHAIYDKMVFYLIHLAKTNIWNAFFPFRGRAAARTEKKKKNDDEEEE